MVELLSKKTEMPVHRAEDGMEVLADNVYLIPPKKNLTIFHGKLLLNDKVRQPGHQPAHRHLSPLAGRGSGRTAMAIILSGTGSDGTRGVRAIKELGGMVMVQSEESAKFDGMPRAAISTGSPTSSCRRRRCRASCWPMLPTLTSPEKSGPTCCSRRRRPDPAVCRTARKTRVDFTYYKPSTITRRIERRMSVNQIGDFEEYVATCSTIPAR
jgi:two-component system, chemotaxis family, CheB/CheR fusion protein